MKHLLNTLYITTQGTYLAREGETILIRVGEETRFRIPIHTLGGVVCFGQVSCSPFLMGLCAEHNVPISFLTEQGRFLARVQGAFAGNVLLRREQYRWADSEEKSARIAQSIVIGKIANYRIVLLWALRDNPDRSESPCLELAVGRMARIMKDLREPLSLNIIRGKEGEATRIYFGVFDHLVLAQKESFTFVERNRRPPLDNINALLSFLYALLVHDVTAALEGVGLDSAVGYLHRDRPGRPGLALDLMEELRPLLADRLALSLINRQQVKVSGFRTTETGAVFMNDVTRKEILVAYQKRKQEEIQHPFLGEQITWGLIPHVQALLLSRHLRGELDAYPPFFWK